MPPKPAVSVIILTYNRLPLLQACLTSLHRQTFQDFEIIVVNNDSDPAKPCKTREFLATQPDVLVVNLPTNVGIATARNLGIQAANADLLAFIDDDCTAAPDWLETLLSPFKDPAVAGAGGKLIVVPANYVSFENGCVDRFGTARTVNPTEAPRETFPYFVGCNMAFRKALVEGVGGFDETFCFGYEEPDLCVRLVKGGRHLVFENKAVVFHHIIPQGKYAVDKFYWMARMRRLFMLKHFFDQLTVLSLVSFEAFTSARHLYRFLAGLLGLRPALPASRLPSTLIGGLAGYAEGLARLCRDHKSLRLF